MGRKLMKAAPRDRIMLLAHEARRLHRKVEALLAGMQAVLDELLAMTNWESANGGQSEGEAVEASPGH